MNAFSDCGQIVNKRLEIDVEAIQYFKKFVIEKDLIGYLKYSIAPISEYRLDPPFKYSFVYHVELLFDSKENFVNVVLQKIDSNSEWVIEFKIFLEKYKDNMYQPVSYTFENFELKNNFFISAQN